MVTVTIHSYEKYLSILPFVPSSIIVCLISYIFIMYVCVWVCMCVYLCSHTHMQERDNACSQLDVVINEKEKIMSVQSNTFFLLITSF